MWNGYHRPAVVFDAQALRRWCAAPHPNGGSNAEVVFGQDVFDALADEPSRLVEEALLTADMPEYVWRAIDGVDDVAIWRTTGSDGPDGGGVVTVNVDRIVLMAAFLDAGDLVTGELDTQGRMLVPTVDALAQALGAVAEAVNRTVERFHAAVESWRAASQLLSCCPACRWDNPTGAASCGGCGITLTCDAYLLTARAPHAPNAALTSRTATAARSTNPTPGPARCTRTTWTDHPSVAATGGDCRRSPMPTSPAPPPRSPTPTMPPDPWTLLTSRWRAPAARTTACPEQRAPTPVVSSIS